MTTSGKCFKRGFRKETRKKFYRDEGYEVLLIIGTIELTAGRLDAVKPTMATMVETSRVEAGCLEYFYAQDVLDPSLIHVKERWTDRRALDEHFKSAHLKNWRASWTSLGIGERNLCLYEVGEPQTI